MTKDEDEDTWSYKEGAPEVFWQKKPIPDGPYILVPQHREGHFLKHFMTESHITQKNFELRWGHFTYAIGEDGQPVRAAYWLDTSD